MQLFLGFIIFLVCVFFGFICQPSQVANFLHLPVILFEIVSLLGVMGSICSLIFLADVLMEKIRNKTEER